MKEFILSIPNVRLLRKKQIAFYACELREKGMSGKEIAEELEKFRSRVRLIACLDTLEYLARGGRLPKTVAAIGNKLQFKPIITFTKEGEIEVVKRQGEQKSDAGHGSIGRRM